MYLLFIVMCELRMLLIKATYLLTYLFILYFREIAAF